MIRSGNFFALRMERSRLLAPVPTKAEYDELFRNMSPVPTDYWTRPGSAPILAFRSTFNDQTYNDKLRSNRTIVKGRFQKNGIAYVRFDELSLYAAVYRKEFDRIGPLEWRFIDLLEHEGPMTIGMFKEITGLLVKDITPVLHKLQSAFLVFEDQKDDDWERSWYLMQNEFPELDLNTWTEAKALHEILQRFVLMNVFVDAKTARSFFNIPAKRLEAALELLADEGILARVTLDGEAGYVLSSDLVLLEGPDLPMKPAVFAMHRNDFLVRSKEYLLKDHFASPDWGTMYYLLIDGKFQGAVHGGFKFGPHIVENVRVDLPEAECIARRQEIFEAVAQVLDPDVSPIRHYNGIDVK